MSRTCPVCSPEPLARIHAGDVVIDGCGKCGGLFFDNGELELFPDRPSTEALRRSAQHAPGRCARSHPIPRAERGCRTCGGLVCVCPGCSERLGLVALGPITVDACAACGGVWLDAGEFEALEGVATRTVPIPPVPAGSLRGWEIPEADTSSHDAWRTPGHAAEVGARRGQGSPGKPFSCRHCDVELEVGDAWALEGDTYCLRCRPEGATSGRGDPELFSNLVGKVLRFLGTGVGTRRSGWRPR